MWGTLHAVARQALADEQAPPDSPMRIAVRVLLGALIVVLVAYVVIEQVGYWRRRRSGRG